MIDYVTTYSLIAIGILFSLIAVGPLNRPTKDSLPPRSARLLIILAFITAAIGVSAGLWGPITLGGITLEPFTENRVSSPRGTAAHTYATRNLAITCQPAPSWQGRSRNTLKCTVRNNGKRSVSWIHVSLPAQKNLGTETVDIKLSGPFPAGKTRPAVLIVPKNADLQETMALTIIENWRISAARF